MLSDVDPCKWYPVEMEGPLICPKLPGQETVRLSKPLNLSDCWSCTGMMMEDVWHQDHPCMRQAGYHSKLLCWPLTTACWNFSMAVRNSHGLQHDFGLLIPPCLFSVSDAKLTRSKGIKANASMANLVVGDMVFIVQNQIQKLISTSLP